MMIASREDLTHVLNMVLLDNKGNTITEALAMGIERAVQFYIGNIEATNAEFRGGTGHGAT